MRTYLDYNATAPLRAEARDAMIAALDLCGNPSSVHAEGRAAKAVVERARADVAAAIGCKPGEVVFTSGATEAASVLRRLGASAVLVEPTAHDALWAHRRGAQEGAAGAGRVLAMGLANSETGIVSDLPGRAGGIWTQGDLDAEHLLVDATQAIGRVPFAFGWSGADFAVVAAHKFGGPKGVGALIVREGIDIEALGLGGGQEMGRRSGTENVAALAGFGAAAAAAARDLADGRWVGVAQMRDMLEETLMDLAPAAIAVGRDRARLPNTSCLMTPGWKGETQVMAMDLAGYAISAGSACSSGKVRPSRVLQAMGHSDPDAACAIRVSLGLATTEAEVMGFARTWAEKYRAFRARAA